MPRLNGTTKTRNAPPRVAIVVSRYNATITDRLLEGALQAYRKAGGEQSRVRVLDAPGAFELPAIALASAKSGKVRGVVMLGCIIRGETRHDQYLASAVAHGAVEVTLRTGVPVAFGVLTTEDAGQARARAGGEMGNKGAEAMEAVLQTIATIDSMSAAGGSRRIPARPDKARAGGAGGKV